MSVLREGTTKLKRLWIALCLGRHRYEIEVFEPEGRVLSKTVVRAKTHEVLMGRAEDLVRTKEAKR